MKLQTNGDDSICLKAENNHQNESHADQETPDEETPEVLLKALMDAIQKLWLNMKLAFTFVMIELGGYKFLDRLIQWSVRNPYTAICIVAGLLMFLLPFLLLVGIGLSTLLMTLTGFIVLEGILLSLMAVLLIGCAGGLFLVILFVRQLNRSA